MGYMHIPNLYKDQTILLFKECFASEKIHGSSAHIGFRNGRMHFFSGGCKQEIFEAIFDREAIMHAFEELGQEKVTLYGEVYGGKIQKMRETYGDQVRFVAFEVKIGDMWLPMDNAASIIEGFGLDFVPFERIEATTERITEEMLKPSVQAAKNGISENKMREGVVLHPLVELTKNNGKRVIAKHKNAIFQETRTPRDISPDELKVIADADEVALEWVTDQRLQHVIDKLPPNLGIQETGMFIKAMTEDVLREGEGEFVNSKAVRKAIGRRAAKIFKEYLAGKVLP